MSCPFPGGKKEVFGRMGGRGKALIMSVGKGKVRELEWVVSETRSPQSRRASQRNQEWLKTKMVCGIGHVENMLDTFGRVDRDLIYIIQARNHNLHHFHVSKFCVTNVC